VIDADIQTIIIYSYLQNIKKRRLDMGWSLNTIYNLKKGNDTKREEVKMKQRETQIPMELAPQREIDKKQQRPKVIPPKPQQRPKVIPPKTNKKSK
jgi:hypothetical protein